MSNNGNFAALPWHEDEALYQKYLENLAPIVLFTYNRLDHTKKTVEALKRNNLAKYSRLYIFSDGARDEAGVEKVEEVRKYLHQITGFKEVHIKEWDKNVGLTENIVEGVSTLTEKYGKVIVLEDDIVTAKYFLQFMNDALEIYKDEDRVMTISGFCRSTDKEGLPETYFLPWFSCWGWATWKRSWKYYEYNPEKALNETTPEIRRKIDMNGTWDNWEQVVNNSNGNIYTWDIFFYMDVINQNGLNLYSKWDLSKNIGADGSGEHGASTIWDRGELEDVEVKNFTLDIEESEIGVKRVEDFNTTTMNSIRRSWLHRLWLDTASVNFWQNERGLQSVYALSRDTSWLVMGDGRNFINALLLKARGFKKAMPADTIPNRLQIALEDGIIDDFLILTADKPEVPTERYDYVFCKDIFRITKSPYAFIAEMLRIAKKGVVLTGPFEMQGGNNINISYGIEGNFIYKLSLRELTKLAISLNLTAVCWYAYNEASIPGAEYQPANEEQSPAFKQLKEEIAKLDAAVNRGETECNAGSVILFKEEPTAEEKENLARAGVNYQALPKNPYMSP